MSSKLLELQDGSSGCSKNQKRAAYLGSPIWFLSSRIGLSGNSNDSSNMEAESSPPSGNGKTGGVANKGTSEPLSSFDATGASSPASAAQVKFVPTEVILKRISSLSNASEDELRTLIQAYDEDGVGGLTERQWTLFCHNNRKRFSSLGEQMVDFDRTGDYIVMTVEHGYDAEDGKKTKQKYSFTQGVIRFVESFAAGGIAGAVSKTVIAPADRVKIIFQVDSTKHFTLRQAFNLGTQTVREFGITGLWIGNGATMLRVVPYAAITYVSFDYYHRSFSLLAKRKEDGSVDEGRAVTIRFLSGALAGATSTTCTYPLDLMRARFAAHSTSAKARFPSYSAAFRDATSQNGLRSLYAGLFPTLVGIMPYAGCSFACFETLKYYIVKYDHLGSDRDIPTYMRVMAGGFSGLVAQSATYPLDIVRRRMQVTPQRYRGVCHALSTILKEEGLRQGLYKGLAMNWIKGPIATATSFTVNDLAKRRTRNYHETAARYSHRENIITLPDAIVCGGVAACIAKFLVLPFDKLKIMYQLGIADKEKGNKKGLAHLHSMLRKNPNLWSSGGVTMLRVVPYGALTYSFFDVFQTYAERLLYSHKPTLTTNFVAGAAAASLGTFLVYPLDLVRTRTAASADPSRFSSYWWLLRAMARRNGIASLWEGCYLAMMGVGILAGIGFASYEYLKERFECHTFATRMLAGMAAGIAGQTITYPLSVAKRNRQAERVVYASMCNPRKSLFLKPGFFKALYCKMPFSWTLSSFTFGISFAVNDCCRDLVVRARKDMIHDMVPFSESTATA